MVRRVVPVAAVAAVALCAMLSARHDDPIEITLERTACFGPCPVYTVRITGDGGVEYTGTQIVRVVGSATAQISRAAVRDLADKFIKMGYFELDNAYYSSSEDISSTITSIQLGSRTKSVVRNVAGPAALREIEWQIDRVAGVARWTTVDRATVRGLLRSGWNPRSEEGTIFLRWAVERNYEDSVAALLEAGADPNADRSPIIQMAQRASIVRFLLRAGARVDAGRGSGWTALMCAAISPNIYPVDVVRVLIEAGADVNATTADEGKTVLMAAAESGRLEKVRLVLKAGASVSAIDKRGRTALDIAREAQLHVPYETWLYAPDPPEFDAIIAQLRAAGAK